jgi:hypothetical protein
MISLIGGDAAALLAVTLVGFLSHYGTLKGARWASSFFPALAGWLVVAPWLGAFRREATDDPRQIWRPGLAALISAPLAATLRGFWLGSDIPPTFVVVFGLTNTVGIVLWRGIWGLLRRRNSRVQHG